MSTPRSVAAPSDSAKPLLLIVDDDEEIRAQMRWALVADYEILQAGDRRSALDVSRTRQPPVVLLDLGLPPKPGTPEEGLQAVADLVGRVIERRRMPLEKVLEKSKPGRCGSRVGHRRTAAAARRVSLPIAGQDPQGHPGGSNRARTSRPPRCGRSV